MVDVLAKSPTAANRVQERPASVDHWYTNTRLIGLTRFAMAITILNVVGHLYLGFEQAWIVPFVALATTYSVDLVGEFLDARAEGRAPAYLGSWQNLILFLLPAHISGLAVGMLLYSPGAILPVVFACALAIASKYVVRLPRVPPAPGLPRHQHYLNPSNLGIATALLLFPSVGIAPPYQFAENLVGIFHWLVPLIIVGTGSYLNLKATKRYPLIIAWLAAFAAQALVRAVVHDTPWVAGLGPMTGFAFVLFTFYMVTDPATTPSSPREQVVFGASVAAVYGLLMELHVVFGLFFALAIVTVARAVLVAWSRRSRAAVWKPAA